MIIHMIETNCHVLAPITFTKTDIDCVANARSYATVFCDVDFAELFILKELLPDENIRIHTYYQSRGVFEDTILEKLNLNDCDSRIIKKMLSEVYYKGVRSESPLLLGMLRAEVTLRFDNMTRSYVVPNMEKPYRKDQILDTIRKNLANLLTNFSIAAYGVEYNSMKIREVYGEIPEGAGGKKKISEEGCVIYRDNADNHLDLMNRSHYSLPKTTIYAVKNPVESIVKWRDSPDEVLIHYDTMPTLNECEQYSLGRNDKVVNILVNKLNHVIEPDNYELLMKCIPGNIPIDCILCVRK